MVLIHWATQSGPAAPLDTDRVAMPPEAPQVRTGQSPAARPGPIVVFQSYQAILDCVGGRASIQNEQ
jgi:hypothetical protein